MPYMIVEQDGEFCVHKKGEDGMPMGDSMGCHSSRDSATQQMRAIYANEKAITFKQDASGQWWFIGLYSNNFKDRQDEILSEEAHKDFVQWANENNIKPQVTLIHQPKHNRGFWQPVFAAYDAGFITSKVLNAVMRDFYKEYAIAETEKLIYANGFTVVVAKVHEDRLAQINRLKNSDITLGMSHGFVALKMDGNIYERYRSFEFSVLPLSRAANVFTETHIMEVMQMDRKDKEWLDGIQDGLGEAVDQATTEKKDDLTEAGVEFKEEPVQEETPTETVETEVKSFDVNELIKLFNIPGLIDAVKEQLVIRDQKIEALETRMKELEKDDDSKVASVYTVNWQKAISNPLETPAKKTEEKDKTNDVWDATIMWGDSFK